MKIGVGINTTPARRVQLERYFLHRDGRCEIYVHNDSARLGVAQAKNAVLRELYDRGCTHIFTFDDDCYPTRPEWMDYILANQHCPFYALPNIFVDRVVKGQDEYQEWSGGLGCFSYQTRDLLDAVGGYNTAYERYGFEDAARLARIRRCLMTEGYPTLFRIPFFIHSEDAFHENPPANMSREMKEFFIARNRSTYEREISVEQLHYPFY